MRSLSIGKIFSIRIELHSTFVFGGLLLILFMVMLALFNLFPVAVIAPSILFIFLLFLSVFFHELAHSIVLIEKGFKVEKIILLPIGGISVSESLPETPAGEFAVSIAGPLFNFVVAAAILLITTFFNIPLGTERLLEENFFAVLESPLLSLFYINIVLGTFNLFFPALPLDGGRVARSLLAYFIGWKTATNIVSKLSVFLAIFLFILGFFSGNILVAVIAMFIFFGAQQENRAVEMKETLKDASVVPLLQKSPPIISGDLTLQELFPQMVKNNQLAFLVKQRGGFGLVSYKALEQTPKANWEKVTAEQAAAPLPSISLKANASKLMEMVLAKGYSLLPVVQHGELIGAIYARDLQKLYEIEKLKQKQS